MRSSHWFATRIGRPRTCVRPQRQLTEVAVRMRSTLVSVAAVLGMVVAGGSSGALSAAAELPARMVAPAYDTVTVANLHELALALTSYGLDAGGYDGLTVAALAGWGWTPSDRTAVTIWVVRDSFRVVAQDVRVGSAQYEFTSAAGDSSSGVVERSATQPAEPPPTATATVIPTTSL